ncbi:MAG: response regulator transcription factor [Pseudomonadota bacterium]
MPNRYRCLIVDDEALGRELISTHLEQFPQFEVVASCASAVEASRVLAEESVDLLFLDIEMPVMKGTDFYQGLRERPAVIFTTAYRDYAVEGFELEAVDYLLKPIVFARFFTAIQRFLASREGANLAEDATPTAGDAAGGTIFVRKDRKHLRLWLDEILYVHSAKDYLEVYTKTQMHMIKGTMNAFSTKLGSAFLRIHRSYLVNHRHITAITAHDVEVGSVELPISDQYRAAVMAVIEAR